MTTNTITIKGIREAAKAYEARKYNRIALRLRALAVKAETGKINPEQAIDQLRHIEAQHRIPYKVQREIALGMVPLSRPQTRAKWTATRHALAWIAILVSCGTVWYLILR